MLKRIRLELARGPEFPEAGARQGYYERVAPPDGEGYLGLDA